MGEADKAEFARFGAPAGWSFAVRHRVRWSECAPFGHAKHRAYFEWFEEARNRYLEALGLPALSAGTPEPVIAETAIRYNRPLACGDPDQRANVDVRQTKSQLCPYGQPLS